MSEWDDTPFGILDSYQFIEEWNRQCDQIDLLVGGTRGDVGRVETLRWIAMMRDREAHDD